MLLHRGSRAPALQQLDIRGYMHGPYPPERVNPLPFTPVQKISGGAGISGPRVLVADGDGEELDEAERGAIPAPVMSTGSTGPPESDAGTRAARGFIRAVRQELLSGSACRAGRQQPEAG